MLVLIKSQKGFSLIESMISLVVISIGLLGIASLQYTALTQNSSSFWHSQAVLMAHDMSDRVRANMGEEDDYVGIDTSKAYASSCIDVDCSPANLVPADATEWKTLVETLPSGRGIIREPVAALVDIVVMWDDESTGATGTNCGSNPKVDLTCYTITISTP